MFTGLKFSLKTGSFEGVDQMLQMQYKKTWSNQYFPSFKQYCQYIILKMRTKRLFVAMGIAHIL